MYDLLESFFGGILFFAIPLISFSSLTLCSMSFSFPESLFLLFNGLTLSVSGGVEDLQQEVLHLSRVVGEMKERESRFEEEKRFLRENLGMEN